MEKEEVQHNREGILFYEERRNFGVIKFEEHDEEAKGDETAEASFMGVWLVGRFKRGG